MKKVLIVDDELNIREIIKINLELAGYQCFEAEDGKKAIDCLKKTEFDIALLDISMPNKNGFEIVGEFVKKNIPVIFLTAKGDTSDKVKGLKLGADDYITKPFESMELLARIESVLRRKGHNNNIFRLKDVEVDFSQRLVKLRGEVVELTAQEFNLLEILVKNKNLALSREKLLEDAWGYDYFGDTRTVDIHIQRLRKKLNLEDKILTVYKYGYRIESDS